jgi:uncharacterized lipoprotein YajG
MYSHAAVAVVVASSLLAACASTPTDGAATPTQEAASRKERCGEAVTGSRIPQCDRQDVRTVSRDELERRQMLQGDPGLIPLKNQ